MGQWGLKTCESDDVMDFIVAFTGSEGAESMTQEQALPTLVRVINRGDEYELLGVVVWLLEHSFKVTKYALDAARLTALKELENERLMEWSDITGREDRVKKEIELIEEAKKSFIDELIGEACVNGGISISSTKKVIELPCYGIVVILEDEEHHALTPNRWNGGTISSILKEECDHCGSIECDMDCPEFGEYATSRDSDDIQKANEEKFNFRRHKASIDTLESIILAHAMAGIDIESLAYIEGIETAEQKIGNIFDKL